MPDAHADPFRRRAIRRWLLVVAALIVVMVLVGGTTRLTESGLSIVEWQPVTGTLPPLSQAQWQAEFEKYQTIPQYRERNLGNAGLKQPVVARGSDHTIPVSADQRQPVDPAGLNQIARRDVRAHHPVETHMEALRG